MSLVDPFLLPVVPPLSLDANKSFTLLFSSLFRLLSYFSSSFSDFFLLSSLFFLFFISFLFFTSSFFQHASFFFVFLLRLKEKPTKVRGTMRNLRATAVKMEEKENSTQRRSDIERKEGDESKGEEEESGFCFNGDVEFFFFGVS